MLFLVHHQDEFLFDDIQMSDQVRRKDLLPLFCPTTHLFLAVGICHGWFIYAGHGNQYTCARCHPFSEQTGLGIHMVTCLAE